MRALLFIFIFSGFVKITVAQSTSDSLAIIKLLEKESSSWRSGNIKEHASCWVLRPYSRILVSTPEGRTFDVPPQSMINPAAGAIGHGGSFVSSNIKMSVHGNNAWVSHNEESTSADGKKSYSYEIRLLEKIHGAWKLVGQSIHVYDPVKK